MSIEVLLPLILLASLVAVPAVLGAYSRLVKRRFEDDALAKTASLEWVRRAERLWFRVSPFVLIAAIAMAVLLFLEAK